MAQTNACIYQQDKLQGTNRDADIIHHLPVHAAADPWGRPRHRSLSLEDTGVIFCIAPSQYPAYGNECMWDSKTGKGICGIFFLTQSPVTCGTNSGVKNTRGQQWFINIHVWSFETLHASSHMFFSRSV